MTNDGSLMQVKSIAECSPLDLHYAIIGLENQFFVFLRVAVLDRFYMTVGQASDSMTALTYIFNRWVGA